MVAQRLEHLLVTQKVEGSSPFHPAKYSLGLLTGVRVGKKGIRLGKDRVWSFLFVNGAVLVNSSKTHLGFELFCEITKSPSTLGLLFSNQ